MDREMAWRIGLADWEGSIAGSAFLFRIARTHRGWRITALTGGEEDVVVYLNHQRFTREDAWAEAGRIAAAIVPSPARPTVVPLVSPVPIARTCTGNIHVYGSGRGEYCQCGLLKRDEIRGGR